MTTIRLGYQIPTGEEVKIPLKHLAITGQTQEAGKTTALEALITRSQLSAVTFVTKRGEGSFRQARRIKPYFREQADWQYVASVLEASRGEKLKFERAWIIRASKGAQTLREVQINVRRLMKTAKGMSADVYLTLDAYLDVVVPAIDRVEWASRVDLGAGVNVMDLSAVPSEMQHLCIKSTLDWVLEHANGVIVVIPEAWKFVPQGRGTPVKLSAEAFIRQAAAMHNYLWLDSQDLGGIEKTILRSVAVWIIGVQREANEIKRTLDNIPAGVSKPKPEQIATLGLGEFYACWGSNVVKTYVQPEWMHEPLAVLVAQRQAEAHPLTNKEEDDMDGDSALLQQLREEIATLREENRMLREKLSAVARKESINDEPGSVSNHARSEKGTRGTHPDVGSAAGRDRQMAGAVGAAAVASSSSSDPAASSLSADRRVASHPSAVSAHATGARDVVSEEAYQAIRARLLEEKPTLLKILAVRPELVVEVEPRVVTVDGATMRGRICRMMKAGWFNQPRAVSAVRQELARTGSDPGGGGALGIALNDYVKDGFLLRDGGGFTLNPSVKVTERELSVV